MPIAKKNQHGDCYEAAANYILSLPPKEWKNHLLIHAEVAGQGELTGISYGHAFVVNTKTYDVIDKSNGHDIKMPSALYYYVGQINKIDNTHQYTYAQMQRKILDYKHWGPWDLETSSGY
jgi:hypothetical protein